MATSGSYNFSVTAAQIIAAAYEDLSVISPGGTVASVDSVMALSRLNMIAKQWQGSADMGRGLKVWSRKRIHLFLAKGQQEYLIGPASTDARATTQYGRTTLSAAEASGQTVLSITSNTDTTTFPGTTVTMTASDIIGIQLDDGTIHWSTISGTPGATATVAVALTGDAAAGNYVWWFTSRAQRFVMAEAAVLRNVNYNDMPLDCFNTVQGYDFGVVDKYADGQPTALLIEPQLTNTRITLNSQPTDVEETIVITGQYPAEDYDATTDDIAFPQEYYLPLKWELQFQLHPSTGREWTAAMDKAYTQAINIAKNLNPEVCDLYFQPG